VRELARHGLLDLLPPVTAAQRRT